MGFVRAAVEWISRVGRYSPAVSAFLQALDEVEEINRLTAAIKTANNPPATIDELQRPVGAASEAGYHDHHIVNQHDGNRRKVGDARIDGRANQVRIPVLKHLDINGWYSKGNKEFGGLSPRDYLRDKSWDEQTRVGIKILRDMKVLK
jgi:hypothetical protein